jgi:hypothetical protein
MSNIAKQSAVLITWFHIFKREARVRKNDLPCWRAPDPPVRRTNQNWLIGPSIVPKPQFSTAWKTQWHDASLIKFANFQIAIFRRELDR